MAWALLWAAELPATGLKRFWFLALTEPVLFSFRLMVSLGWIVRLGFLALLFFWLTWALRFLPSSTNGGLLTLMLFLLI